MDRPWHDRYRRIIDAYRASLMQVNPAACKAVDIRVDTWGESWVTDEREVDLDKLMTAGEIAERFGLKPHNIRDWARRHPERITTHKQGSKTLFQVREVLRYQSGKG